MDNLKILYAEYSSTGKYTVFPYVVSKPILFSILYIGQIKVIFLFWLTKAKASAFYKVTVHILWG